MPEIEISKRDSFKHYVSIDVPGKKLKFEFSTRRKNVAFGLFYQCSQNQTLQEINNIHELFKTHISPLTLHISNLPVVRRKSIKSNDSRSFSEKTESASGSMSSDKGLDKSSKEKDQKKSFEPMDLVEIIPIAKYESYKYLIKGYFVAPVAGTYIFCFDNTFSINTSKRVSYQITICDKEETQINEDSINSTHNGWLLKKKRKKIQGWTKYWFSFQDGILSYSLSPEESSIGFINIALSTVSKVPSSFTIIVDSGSSIFRLKALNEEDYLKWLNVVNTFKTSKSHVRQISNSEVTKLTNMLKGSQETAMVNLIFKIQEEISNLRVLHHTLNDISKKPSLIEPENKTSSLSYITEELNSCTTKISNLLAEHVSYLTKPDKSRQKEEDIASITTEVFYDAEDAVLDVEDEIASEKVELSSSDDEESIAGLEEETLSKWPIGYFPVIINRREALPVEMKPFNFGIGAFLRRNIGKDFSNISMPISMNEPLNILQRQCEELDYSELLDRANKSSDSIERLCLVSAFAVSAYASTLTRAERKPFNPLLGETFECVREDKGFKFISEKVSHKPLIIACHAQSENFEFWQSQQPKTKFWGKSMEITPNALSFVKLAKVNEVFSWNKVTSSARNILGGKPYVEHFGEMKITNHKTGEYCVINFKGGGMFSSSKNEIFGYVCYPNGEKISTLFGSWHEKLMVEDFEGKRETLWRCNQLPENSSKYYGFTKFAIELNEITENLKEFLPPTDTRLRPDQRLYEEGRIEEAEAEKIRLEEIQRERRKEAESKGTPWKPLWFFPEVDTNTEKEVWLHNQEYWKQRNSKNFEIKLNLW